MELPLLYYTLPELAEKWGRSENDLLHMAATGELALSVKHFCGYLYVWSERNFRFFCEPIYVQLYPKDAEMFLESWADPEIISSALWEGKKVCILIDETHLIGCKRDARKDDPLLNDTAIANNGAVGPLIIREMEDLRILPDEVARVEAKFPKLAAVGQAGTTAPMATDEIKWTWPEMQEFAKIARKTINNRAKQLGISFLERPPRRGKAPEKGLSESDLRRIMAIK